MTKLDDAMDVLAADLELLVIGDRRLALSRARGMVDRLFSLLDERYAAKESEGEGKDAPIAASPSGTPDVPIALSGTASATSDAPVLHPTTTEELDRILNSEDDTPVEILPDGSVRPLTPPAIGEMPVTGAVAKQLAEHLERALFWDSQYQRSIPRDLKEAMRKTLAAYRKETDNG